MIHTGKKEKVKDAVSKSKKRSYDQKLAQENE
jgi:hypothetical protein